MPDPVDPVDTKPAIDKLCAEKSCKAENAELAKCAARIKAKGHGTCEPWYLDFQKCVDACVRGRLARNCSTRHVQPLTPEWRQAASFMLTYSVLLTPTPPFFFSFSFSQAAPKLFATLK